jgi:hypothetical protein
MMDVITRPAPIAARDVDTVRIARSLAASAILVLFVAFSWLVPPPAAILLGFAALTYGVGAAAVAIGPKTRADVGVAGAIGLGIAVNVLGSVLMVIAHVWHPRIFMIGLLALSAVMHAVVLVPAIRGGAIRVVARQAMERANLRSTAGWPEVVGLVGVIAFVYSLIAARHAQVSGVIPIGGYLSVVGVGWYLALAVVVLTVAYFAWQRLSGGLLLASLQLVVAVFAVPILAYSAPRSQSAEKHLAVVRTIIEQGSLDHIVDIYKAWPGFFSSVAMAMQGLGGQSEGLRLATYWPLLMALTTFAVVVSLCRILHYGRITGYVVATIACLANVLQQDYFSPQSLGYILALTLFAVCLANVSPFGTPEDAMTPSKRHPGFRIARWQIGYALLISSAIAVSHQFTPFAVSGAIGVLVLWGAILPFWRGVWLAAAVAVPAIVWALLHFSVISSFLSPQQIGNTSNFSTPQTGSAPGLARLSIVAISSSALLLSLLLIGSIALVGGWRSLRNRTTLAMGSAAVFAFLLIIITPYGNEGIFRASLFAVPWLVILGLPAYNALVHGGRMKIALLAAILVGLTTLYVISSAGLDASTVTRPADIAVYEHVTRVAERHPNGVFVVIQIGPGDLPTNRSVAPGNVTYLRSTSAVPRLRTEESAAKYINSSFAAAADYVGNPDRLTLYVVFSPASIAYAREYGQALPSDLANIAKAMKSDPQMTLLSARQGTILTLVKGSATRG